MPKSRRSLSAAFIWFPFRRDGILHFLLLGDGGSFSHWRACGVHFENPLDKKRESKYKLLHEKEVAWG
jgi:hypothetical protein